MHSAGRLIAAAVLVASTRGLCAQNAPPPGPAPKPCATSPERHQFDFWIGDWSVSTAGGGVAGKSSIQSISGGCAILENWTSARGGQGKSISAFNSAVGAWQQYWIGQDGNVTEYRESEWHGKSLSFLARQGGALMRLTFTPMDDGTVRQFGEVSADNGKTWKTTYDLRYHRV